jgi:hypothetical protein
MSEQATDPATTNNIRPYFVGALAHPRISQLVSETGAPNVAAWSGGLGWGTEGL